MSMDNTSQPPTGEADSKTIEQAKGRAPLLKQAEKHRDQYISTENPEGCTLREYFNAYIDTNEEGQIYQMHPNGMGKAYTDFFRNHEDIALLAEAYETISLAKLKSSLEEAQNALGEAREKIDRDVPYGPSVDDCLAKVGEREKEVQEMELLIRFLKDLSAPDK